MSQIFIKKLRVEAPDRDTPYKQLIAKLQECQKIRRININPQKGLIRIISDGEIQLHQLQAMVRPQGFKLYACDELATARENKILNLTIDGMHCHSCELTIERKFKKIKGVAQVTVNAAKGQARITCSDCQPDLAELQTAIKPDGYTIRTPQQEAETNPMASGQRPKFWELVGLFGLVLLIASLFSKLGLINSQVQVGGNLTVGAAFILGLVAASSSCVAVTGGLLLSCVAKFNEKYASVSTGQRLRPVFLFILGRVVSYGLLGGLIGLIGHALSPSPTVTGFITIVAALYMLTMGLEMLHLAPRWLERLLPRVPKTLGHKILSTESQTSHFLAPLLLGAATFFLPCGFTQSLQIYALTTQNPVTSGLLLLAFALGTTPALLALGWVSGAFKGRSGRLFFRLAGALVVVLGVWNLQNGLTVAGYPLSWPQFKSSNSSLASDDGFVPIQNGTQIVNMAVTPGGYSPNNFTLRPNVPTKWVIDAKSINGCLAVLIAPKLDVKRLLSLGQNTIEFTPAGPDTIPFSCSMGMVRGQFRVQSNS